ncbi:hypothetical protein RHGRI_001217 [Rhododendron griersonianum]|uniref:Bromo domain-containing protein n=1 Tax=Rhododendron griersonianum TaxID=479676 RepID=A0AAV6LLJ5_9ERIC|nr:hypothetical protein RHGRI_001217 [Rhododendron griersonianum]
MVRIHMDLETIRTRLENGSYSSCSTQFYRDLLLLFTNAIVFFPKASIESVTAHELRDLVLEEVKKQKSIQRSHSSSPDPAPSNPTSLETKPDPRKPESLLAKHKSSGPILVCRKRSSISAKPTDGKPNPNPNAPAKNSSNLKGGESRKTNERPATGTRSTRSNKGSQTITSPPDSKTNSLADKAGNVMRNDKKKKKKKKNEVAAAAVKKQGAADFLRRIKRNSPLKSGGGEGNSGGGRRENMKRGDRRKEAPLVKPGGSGKRRKEESSPLKQRGAGRPSRKGPAEGGGRKRGREGGGAEAASKQTRKRSRR